MLNVVIIRGSNFLLDLRECTMLRLDWTLEWVLQIIIALNFGEEFTLHATKIPDNPSHFPQTANYGLRMLHHNHKRKTERIISSTQR